MPYLLLACQLALAVTLLSAATGKLLNTEQFLNALRLSRIPKTLVTPVAVLVPTLEMCLAVGLILSTPKFLPFIIAATVGLLGISPYGWPSSPPLDCDSNVDALAQQ